MEIRTYKQAAALIAKRKAQGQPRAKLGNNCYLEPRFYDDAPGAITVVYHQTDIVTFYPDGKIELRCGGWYTMTTKQNISTFSPFSVYQEKREWFVNTGRDYSEVNRAKPPKGQLPPGIVRFVDGMILDTPAWAAELDAA